MIRLPIAVATAIAISGCASQITGEQLAAINSRQTLELSCDAGCRIAYTDPRDKPQLPTNGYDVMNTAISAAAGVVTSTAPWAAMGATAIEGLRRAGDRDHSTQTDERTDNRQWSETTDTTHTPTVVTQPTPTVVDPVVVTQPEPVIVQPAAGE